MYRYFAVYKPFGYLSQFSEESGHPGLAKLGLSVPKDVWPVGRLDRDSEGLLLLTSDMKYKAMLTSPAHRHTKHYWVQVEGIPDASALNALRQPMNLRINGQLQKTKAAQVQILTAPNVPERIPPIRHRATIPTSWLAMTLTEGKNRQVRRMTAQVGLPTLRLLRVGIGQLDLRALNLAPGECVELNPEQLRLTQL